MRRAFVWPMALIPMMWCLGMVGELLIEVSLN